MSVIPFSGEELASIAALIAREETFRIDSPYLMTLSEGLAAISAANAKAYNATYSDDKHTPYTAAQIRARTRYLLSVEEPREERISWTLRTARLLAYNCVSNGGKDYAGPKVKAALADVLGALLTVAADRLEETCKTSRSAS